MIARIVTRLEELVGDVDLTGLADGKVLAYEAASQRWKPATVSVPVTSVFGRTGAVVLQASDVTAVLAGATIAGALTVTGRMTLGGGAYAESWNSGTWVNLPTTGPSGIGSGGAGTSPWIAYVQSAGQWFTGSVAGDVAYRNTSPGRILLGNDSGGWTAAIQVATAPAACMVLQPRTADRRALDVRGVASQTAPLISLGQKSSTTDREAVILDASLPVSTDASRTGRGTLSAVDYAATRECIRWEADGSAARLGFYGGSAVTKPVVSGAHGSNAALQSLLTALVNLGLITDSTS